MTNNDKELCHLGIRIERDLLNRLADIARQEERSISQIARFALRDYADKKELTNDE